MSGGKGGSQSSQVQIPAYMEDALKQQIARAQAVQNMPYAPIMGPTMAGFTGGQRAGMESQAALAQRMGIISPEYDVASGYMPEAIDVGNGLTAYASYPGAKERVLAAFEENPELRRQYEGLYGPRPTYQETMAGIAADRAAANAPRGTLDVISGGGNGEGQQGGQVNLTAGQSYAANTPGSLSFALGENYQNVKDNPFGVVTSPGAAILGGLSNMALEEQGYTYREDPNAKGGGYYSRDNRSYDDDYSGSNVGMTGWSE